MDCAIASKHPSCGRSSALIRSLSRNLARFALRGVTSVSITTSLRVRKSQQEQKQQQRECTKCASHGMQSAPACEQTFRLCWPSVQGRVQQLLIGRQDDDECERDDRNLQGSGNDPPECCSGKPCCNRRQQAHGCQRHLHDGSPVIARGKFSRSYFYSAFHSGRMFNEADVYGGSREQAAGEHGNEFSYLSHQSILSARSSSTHHIMRAAWSAHEANILWETR